MTPSAPSLPYKWGLRYAPHLGYAPPFEPLYRHSVGDRDPGRHVAFAAHQGFAGILHPWIGSRSEMEIGDFASALRKHDLEAGCIVYAPLDEVMKPAWVSGDKADRSDLIGRVRTATALAKRLGSEVVAVLVMGTPGQDVASQTANLLDNLKFAGDIALGDGVKLGIEPMIAVPGMLFRSTYEAAETLVDVAHPGVKLIFDTGHVMEMDGDVLAAQAELQDMICLYQLADCPNRIEPGAGTIDFVTLLQRLHESDYRGLVELEHGWSADERQVEVEGIARLRDIDSHAMAAAGVRK